jgi:TDG/mug DNA glycosylase family protein
VDPSTIGAYDAGSERYAAERAAVDAEWATAFAGAVTGWRADVGSGPGLYLPFLGAPTLALDASLPMLRTSGATHAVQADVAALPIRTGGLAGAWSSRCYQHVVHAELPAALADLHRSMAVGAPLALSLFAGTGTFVTGDDDGFPGRRFARWEPDRLTEVLVGAGFAVESLSVEVGGEWPPVRVDARRLRTLPDRVGPGMRLLVCGLNPSLHAADRGVGFARPGNRFWPALLAAGLASVDRDPVHALRHHGIGMTDLVKRATVAASELTADEYVEGLARVDRLCAWLQPDAVCMVGLAGWRAAVDRKAAVGWQPRPLGGRPVYVMPSTSGLNASTQLPGFVDHLRTAAAGP